MNWVKHGNDFLINSDNIAYIIVRDKNELEIFFVGDRFTLTIPGTLETYIEEIRKAAK